MLFASLFRITANASVDLQLVRFLTGSRRKPLSELRGHCSCVGLSTAYPRNYRRGGQPKPRYLKSLAAIASMLRMAIVHRPDVHWRWRYINRRRRRVIDRRRRGDIHRLRCNRAANQSSNTESQ